LELKDKNLAVFGIERQKSWVPDLGEIGHSKERGKNRREA
jgi:hypothetical protein